MTAPVYVCAICGQPLWVQASVSDDIEAHISIAVKPCDPATRRPWHQDAHDKVLT